MIEIQHSNAQIQTRMQQTPTVLRKTCGGINRNLKTNCLRHPCDYDYVRYGLQLPFQSVSIFYFTSVQALIDEVTSLKFNLVHSCSTEELILHMKSYWELLSPRGLLQVYFILMLKTLICFFEEVLKILGKTNFASGA